LKLSEADLDKTRYKNYFPATLSIIFQEREGPIFKEKSTGEIKLKLFTGAFVEDSKIISIRPEIVEKFYKCQSKVHFY